MSEFFWNGISSGELGLIVTKPVVRPSWAEEVGEISVPGRTSKLIRRTGIYRSADLTIETVIENASPENLRSIYSVLHGRGRLVLPGEEDVYLNAEVQQLAPEPVALFMGELPVHFSLSPFAYAIEPTISEISAGTGWTEIMNSGSVYSEPELRFHPGSGTVVISVNGAELSIDMPLEVTTAGAEAADWWIVADSEVPIIYYEDSNGAKYSMTQYTSGDMPLLHTGTNYIRYTGDCSAMQINVRERWL